MKLLENNWDADRKKEICIPVPAFKLTVETFKNIPVGQTEMDLDLASLKLPSKTNVTYDDGPRQMGQQRQIKQTPKETRKEIVIENVPKQQPTKVVRNIMDDDDIFNNIVNAPIEQPKAVVQEVKKQ